MLPGARLGGATAQSCSRIETSLPKRLRAPTEEQRDGPTSNVSLAPIQYVHRAMLVARRLNRPGNVRARSCTSARPLPKAEAGALLPQTFTCGLQSHIKVVAQNDRNFPCVRAVRAVHATIRADISFSMNGEDRCERGTERCASARQISRGWVRWGLGGSRGGVHHI